MELIKQNFSIKDLENLSGIKAHTIRIWEKRYSILSPDRTSTNIRTYNNSHLQKLLNISLLNEHGYKISRISKLTDEEINRMVQEINASSSLQNRAINSFKVAMLNFDVKLFHQTFDILISEKTFREIFHQVIVPLLDEIGMLWQTDTIKPIHEHFLVDLLKQKLYLKIAEVKKTEKPVSGHLHVLFLPENEIHDIGILYLYYELLYNNYKAMYLGPTLPLRDMNYLMQHHDNIKFISYFTITSHDLKSFVRDFQNQICKEKTYELLLFGQKVKTEDQKNYSKNIKIYPNIMDFIKTL